MVHLNLILVTYLLTIKSYKIYYYYLRNNTGRHMPYCRVGGRCNYYFIFIKIQGTSIIPNDNIITRLMVIT